VCLGRILMAENQIFTLLIKDRVLSGDTLTIQLSFDNAIEVKEKLQSASESDCVITLLFPKCAFRLVTTESPNLNAKVELTPRLTEILCSMACGMSSSAIARKFEIEVSTVKAHIKNMYKRLGVNSKAHAVHMGESLGLICIFRGGKKCSEAIGCPQRRCSPPS
jgi:DNA-binding CsgD family transcriptional regulator